MRKKLWISVIVAVVLILSYLVGTGFMVRTDVALAGFSLSEDGIILTLKTTVPTSMGYIRGYKNDGGGVKPHYLTFYSTFGGLNSSFGAKNEFELELGENDSEIYFSRSGGGYELVLQKNTETGEWYIPDNNETIGVVDQLLSYDNYDVFEDEIYLCDDVYRSDDTLTHGVGSIALPMAQDVLELKDYDILLCGDGCESTAVVSRASQGYAPAYHVVPDGEIDGNFKTLKFKMEIPEGMLEDVKKQGVYDQIIGELGGQYYYLLVLDEKHYAYIHLERKEGVEKIENEAELADGIVKNAKISFELKNEKVDLNIERVIRLAENKGEELTWDDFKMYNAIETGSGLYILVYDIDETFDLMIGGVPASAPMYIRLVTKADRDNYIDIRTEDVEKFVSDVYESIELCGYPTVLYFRTRNFLEAEYHRVFDPYYDIKSLTISNWEQNGNEATFFYKMTHTYYNQDPDTVDYIKKAKEEDTERYERLYNDYLAEKEANAEYKVILNGDNLELYSNVSPKGVEWQPVKIDEYILG